jgi:hypothetical protein
MATGDVFAVIEQADGSVKRTHILEHGEIYANANVTIQGLTAATPAVITAFNANGASRDIVPDHTTNRLTIIDPGDYKLDYTLSFEGDTNITYTIQILKNGTTQLLDSLCKVKTGNSDVVTVAHSGIDALVATDYLQIEITPDGNSAGFLVLEANFNAMMIN